MPESHDIVEITQKSKISLRNAADCLNQSLVSIEDLTELLWVYLVETFPDFCGDRDFVQWKANEVVIFFAQASDAFFAFDEDGRLIGCAGAQFFVRSGHPSGLQPIEIRSVTVLPRARSLGVSKRLIAELEKSVLESKRFPEGVVFSMTSHNKRIIESALKNGYRKLKPNYLIEEVMADTGLPANEIVPSSLGWTILVKEAAPHENVSEAAFSDQLLSVIDGTTTYGDETKKL